jgi:hypothetical protein
MDRVMRGQFARLTHNPLEQNEGNVCGRLLVLVMEAENLQASSETGKMYIELRIVDFWICMLGRTQTSLRKAFPASLSFI